MKASIKHSSFSPRKVGALRLSPSDVSGYQDLNRIGYSLDANTVRSMMFHLGLNGQQSAGDSSLPSPVTTPSITTPLQFLQAWLAGNVEVVTAARKIDLLIGIAIVGNWIDEEVVQSWVEKLGGSVPYTDFGSLPLSSYNQNFERRTIVRLEEGMRVGNLEEGRAAAVRINAAQEKRDSAALALEIGRNKIGFYGFNNGNNRTYGFLNDPNLPAYVPVANGASASPLWSTKTFAEIQKDILVALVALRKNSKDVIDPKSTPITYALATSVIDYLSTTTDFGISVMDWLKTNYPNVRVESAPELDAAVAGDNAGYMYAETVAGTGSDDGATFSQNVPTRFIVTGVQKLVKGYEEGYSMATAGVMCKRPYAVFRQSGM